MQKYEKNVKWFKIMFDCTCNEYDSEVYYVLLLRIYSIDCQ